MHRLRTIPNREVSVVLLLLIIVFGAISPSFRTGGNLENILVGFSHTATLAIGQSLPILLGGIDLSVGSIMGLAGMIVFDGVMIFHLQGWLVIPLTLTASTLAGAVNGALITRLRLQPFIATLATMAAYRGLTYAISGRQLDPELTTKPISDPLLIGFDDYVGHIPYAFFAVIGLAFVGQFVLSATKFGRDLLTVGGNFEAARLSGIRVNRTIVFAYAFSGFCAGLAALMLVSRMTTSTENLGVGGELSSIAAAIIGGVSLQGGVGNMIGPVIGSFLMGVTLIGLNLVGIPTYAQPVLTGIILLGAVAYDRFLVMRRVRYARAAAARRLAMSL
jgi:ribose/xylose/arabinose/galactoside ABC-type transport system permease subunit